MDRVNSFALQCSSPAAHAELARRSLQRAQHATMTNLGQNLREMMQRTI